MTDEPRAPRGPQGPEQSRGTEGREAPVEAGDQDRDAHRRAKGPVAGREVLIQNRLGLHARAAAQFVKTAASFKAEITVEAGGRKVNGKSIMGLLMLAAGTGTRLKMRAVGLDAAAALEALARLVDQRFGEAA